MVAFFWVPLLWWLPSCHTLFDPQALPFAVSLQVVGFESAFLDLIVEDLAEMMENPEIVILELISDDQVERMRNPETETLLI